ncbi:MAG: shikimate kinase [Candidatus Limiplasma sp.]|nr:shikimate kinase [Candidatus Limiplasma sp.]
MRYGLIGETLGHSHSPRVHALLGDADYALRPLARGKLDAFLRAGDFLGLNVTIPYKQAVVPYCKALGPTAQAVGSVNTLVRREDGTLYGDNTDVYGFQHMAEEAGIRLDGGKALVLGSGGTSLTACHAVRQAGGEAVVVSRKGENHYGNLGRHADAVLVVNTTPVGMYPHFAEAPLELAQFPRLRGVLDVVYNPLRTRLMQQAQALELPCAGGLSMLVWQAARARELFDGRPVPPEQVRAALAALRHSLSNLVLIGMPGSGKTSVGMRCAQALSLPFADTDAWVEQKAGKPIPRIFAEEGESAFRALEAEAIAAVAQTGGKVIATGGGAVLNPENRFNLRMNGVVVRLLRPLEHLSRKGRPLSQGLEGLRNMQQQREPAYRACADAAVENADTQAACVQRVLEVYHEALGD